MALLTVPLARVDKASPRLRLLAIDISGQRFAYLAGQAVMVGPHGAAVRRPFSIASSPERAGETGTLELLIAMEGGSEDLQWATAGALLDIDGPVGTFTFPTTIAQPRLLFVAGGTGIAPVRAMLDHAVRVHPSEKISLLYSTRRSDEFAFVDELRAHERAGRVELHQTVTRDDGSAWDGKRGRIGRGHFEAVLHEPASTLCFICGPSSLVSESAATLRDLGVPDALIRTEGWGRTTG
ncbi:MAG TPA: FAD-binding oxidoreductase [Vicinamibacterales bacterium]|nr:FAD-binding oxidoreductase [Vicinamibacterales bacterium]